MMTPFGCVGACHEMVTSREVIEPTVGGVTPSGTEEKIKCIHSQDT